MAIHKRNRSKKSTEQIVLQNEIATQKTWQPPFTKRFVLTTILSFTITMSVIFLVQTIVRIQNKKLGLVGYRQLAARFFPFLKVGGVIYKENPAYQYIDPALLVHNIRTGGLQTTALIDIRSYNEYMAGHISGAISAPIYLDRERVYETLIQREEWLEKLRSQLTSKKYAVVYGYLPNADITLDIATYLKTYIPTKILGVSWAEWMNEYASKVTTERDPVGGVMPTAPTN